MVRRREAKEKSKVREGMKERWRKRARNEEKKRIKENVTADRRESANREVKN